MDYSDFIIRVLSYIFYIVFFILTLNLVEQLNHYNTFKPDFQITYYSNTNTTVCELNPNNLQRQDVYDFCPYVIRILNKNGVS